MHVLHVEPDELLVTSHALLRASREVHDQLSGLRIALARLEMAWSGNAAADDFFVEMQPILHQLSRVSEELVELGLILSRQADLWIEADQRWGNLFRDSQ